MIRSHGRHPETSFPDGRRTCRRRRRHQWRWERSLVVRGVTNRYWRWLSPFAERHRRHWLYSHGRCHRRFLLRLRNQMVRLWILYRCNITCETEIKKKKNDFHVKKNTVARRPVIATVLKKL